MADERGFFARTYDAGELGPVVQMSASFNARAGTLRDRRSYAGRGVRWDDPAFGIAWPEVPPDGRTISERDATYPDVS